MSDELIKRPCAAILGGLLNYDQDTGLFTWRQSRRAVRAGDEAGYIDHRGYRVIRVFGEAFGAHVLAWVMRYGEWPKIHIDHINGIRSDNRISNLRLVTHAQNQWNCRKAKHNRSGIKGVSYISKHDRWYASLKHQGKTVYVGYFETKEEACEAVRLKRIEIHGEFANHG